MHNAQEWLTKRHEPHAGVVNQGGKHKKKAQEWLTKRHERQPRIVHTRGVCLRMLRVVRMAKDAPRTADQCAQITQLISAHGSQSAPLLHRSAARPCRVGPPHRPPKECAGPHHGAHLGVEQPVLLQNLLL
eukprot:361150-Chlamydomonas_euryale.AAC.1